MLENKIGSLRGLWRRAVASILCYFGHHDYETASVHEDYAILYCFYCEHEKCSYALPASLEEAQLAYKQYFDETTQVTVIEE